MASEDGNSELKSRLAKFFLALLVGLVGLQIGGVFGTLVCGLALVGRLLSEPLPREMAATVPATDFTLAPFGQVKRRRTYVINSQNL